MEIRKKIQKENIDIKAIFDSIGTTRWNAIKNRFENNKRKLGLFVVSVLICKLNFVYIGKVLSNNLS